MNEKEIKSAYNSAEKELKEEKIKNLKEFIKRTLEKIDVLDTKIKELSEERKLLKMDISNLKEGRLDLIEERQRKDEKAKKTSVAEVVKVVEHYHHYDYWYAPYKIVWIEPIPSITNPIYYGGPGDTTTITGDSNFFTITSSLAKDFSVGTYTINGHTVNL